MSPNPGSEGSLCVCGGGGGVGGVSGQKNKTHSFERSKAQVALSIKKYIFTNQGRTH